VLALHGLTGSGRGMERVTHLDQVADRYDFTVVYPDGPKGGWDAGTPSDRAAEEQFVARVIGDVVRTGHADPRRIFVVGLSSGALFTQVLGCAMADQIAGIAAVAGPMPADASPACHPARPLPVLLMHGTDDPVIPYRGGKAGPRAGGVEVLSVAATAARWRGLDGCRGRTVTRPVPDRVRDGTHVTEADTPGCAGGVSVALYTVAGGGHAWPGGEHPLPGRIVGRTSRDFDASEVIWRFFARTPQA
jgi:polyhydroxybutyrate depolymerase